MGFLVEPWQESKVHEMRRFKRIKDLGTNNILGSDFLEIIHYILWYSILVTELQKKKNENSRAFGNQE